ncbi:MAG: SDR family NAD(P)-dependent oxidoreductase [Dehalococcoidia bacterium]|nr:SDR family NAD(P)-dependent oxidoreductase [Dehalococcoidia bacterium]
MDLGLAGKTVIVTGGASNIGRAIVLTFAREGAKIAIAELDEKQAHKTADDAKALGGNALVIRTDVGNRESVETMVKKTLDAFGSVDVLVNNVAWANHGPLFVDKPDDEIEKETRLNFWSVIYCSRAVAKHMIGPKRG